MEEQTKLTLSDTQPDQFDWKKEWVGMPEFVQEDKQPCQKIIVSFMTEEDVKKFAEVTGCTITDKTKSLWFPEKEEEKVKQLWIE